MESSSGPRPKTGTRPISLEADVRKVGALVYSLYAGVTGMSGVLIGALFSIHAAMGAKYSTLAFFVVVLAGMGYVPGVVIAALVLGLLQSFVTVYIGGRYTLAASSSWSCTESC